MSISLQCTAVVVYIVLHVCAYSAAIPLEKFYDYGPCFDAFLPQRNDVLRPIYLRVPISMYGHYSCYLFVYDNGFVSPVPKEDIPVPLRLPAEVPFPFIGPFQTDVDIRRFREGAFVRDDPTVIMSNNFTFTQDEDSELRFMPTHSPHSDRDRSPWPECSCQSRNPPFAGYCTKLFELKKIKDFRGHAGPNGPPDCPCIASFKEKVEYSEPFNCESLPVADSPLPPRNPLSESAHQFVTNGRRSHDYRICPPPGRVWFRETSNPFLLCRAQREIRNAFKDHSSFTPLSLVIATWDHVGSFRRQNDLTNTFQLVIASDGVKSFAMFLYADGEMQWSIPLQNFAPRGDHKVQQQPPFLRGPRATVGVNAGDLHRFQRIPLYETASIINIDKTSNIGTPGVWLFKLDGEIKVGFDQYQVSVIEDRKFRRPSFARICVAVAPGMVGFMPLRFDLIAVPGSATSADSMSDASGDYKVLKNKISLFGDSVKECADIEIVPDKLFEGDEEFTLSLVHKCPCESKCEYPSKHPLPPVIIEPSEAIVKIVDNDGVTIGFEQTEYEVLEDNEYGDPQFIEVCVNILSGEIERSLEIVLLLYSGTAEATYDYKPDPVAVTLIQGDSHACGLLGTSPDTVDEQDETFVVEIAAVDYVIVDDHASVATVTIVDNEFMITLEASSLELKEDNGINAGNRVTVCVILLSGLLESDIDITLETLPQGTATADMDYVSTKQALRISNAANYSCLEIATLMDSEYEDVEFFKAGLIPPLSSVLRVDPSSVTISIIDNDVLAIGLQQDMIAVSEDVGVIEICAAVTSGILQSSLQFKISGKSDEAQMGMDFEIIKDEVIVSGLAHDGNQCAEILIIPDSSLESDEQFQVWLSPYISLPITIHPSMTNILIEDNDVIQVGFKQTHIIVPEDDGVSIGSNVTVCAVIITGLVDSMTVELNMTTDSGTASEGIDFESTAAILTFTEYTNIDCAKILVLGNKMPQQDRSFTVYLNVHDMNSKIIIEPATAVISIVDNDRIQD